VTDLTALLRRILDDRDLAACGVLADYLEERGDARGVLLRRMWYRWEDRIWPRGDRLGDVWLLNYVRHRFPEWAAEQGRRMAAAIRA
jgi:hypothetical protein